jgi:uncharacterized membrane protein YbaN (DUF454 family)
MRKILHKTSLHITGYICLIIGVAGLVLPIIPGLIFVAIGIYFFSLASERINTYIESIKQKHPRIAHHYDIFDKKVNRYFKRAY